MNNWIIIGAAIGTMLVALPVVFTGMRWVRDLISSWRGRKAQTQRRTWHGYIDLHGIDTWYVEPEDAPNEPSAKVVLTVVDRHGNPSETMAQALRQTAGRDRMLCRTPNSEEYEFLVALRKDRGYGHGSTPIG